MLKKIFSISILISIIFIGKESYSQVMDLSGSSYILMDEESGRILIEKDSYKTLPMASTTKIMTALIAIEKGDLTKEIVIDEESINIEGSSIYLQLGETISLEDLIYGLMLRSGNDAATAIAKEIGGSIDEFVGMMNDKAKEIKALNTNFTDPHGLGSEGHYSTAYDLALITREAMKFPFFREVFQAKSYTANRLKNNYFVNKNKTLWEYEGGDGGKTGYTIASGRCLVSTASKNGMKLIAVSLNARNWFQDNYRMFDHGFQSFKPYIIYNKDQLIKTINIPNGKNKLFLNTADDLFYPIKLDEINKVKNRLVLREDIVAPIDKGDLVGHIETYIDGVLVKKQNLISGNRVKKKGFSNRILNKFSNI